MNKDVSIRQIKKIKTSNYIQSSLLLKDRRFAFSCDINIYIYNLQNYKCDIVIKGHTNKVFTLAQLLNGKLITISNVLKIFNITKTQYSCEFTYCPENDDSITSLVPLPDNRMVSSSDKPYLTFWNSNPPYNVIKKVMTNEDEINYDGLYKMKQKKNTLLCYQNNCFVLFFYDYKNYEVYHSFSGICICYRYGILETFNKKLIISNEARTVTIIDIKTLTIEKAYELEWGKLGTFTCFYELKRNIIVCGGPSEGLYLLNLLNDTIKSFKSSKDKIIHDTNISFINPKGKVSKIIHIGNNAIINLKFYEQFFEIDEIHV